MVCAALSQRATISPVSALHSLPPSLLLLPCNTPSNLHPLLPAVGWFVPSLLGCCSERACRFTGQYRPSGWLRAVRAQTSRRISLAGVKWSCLRINKQESPPLQVLENVAGLKRSGSGLRNEVFTSVRFRDHTHDEVPQPVSFRDHTHDEDYGCGLHTHTHTHMGVIS